PAVVTERDALASSGARERRDQGRPACHAKARRVLAVDDRAAGECPVSIGARTDRLADLFPMHQVAAHRVAPVHVSPIPTTGIVLKEEMIFAILVYQPVGVVQPPASGGKMESGPACFSSNNSGIRPRRVLGDRLQRAGPDG